MKTAPIFHAMGGNRYVTVRTEEVARAKVSRSEAAAGQKHQSCALSSIDKKEVKLALSERHRELWQRFLLIDLQSVRSGGGLGMEGGVLPFEFAASCLRIYI